MFFLGLFYLISSGLVFSVNCLPSPQDDVTSLEDILAAAGNDSSRYGTNPGNINEALLSDVFGSGGKGTEDDQDRDNDYDAVDVEYIDRDPELKIDAKYNNCSYFEEEGYGYQCVPYYNCKDGVIVTDGSGQSGFDIRSGLEVVELDPTKSKCPSYLEVCCRHPDYEYDPLPTITITTLPPPTRPPVTREPPAPRPTIRPTRPPISCPGPSCPYRRGCGIRNVGGIRVRIQNIDRFAGSTQFGEWPHMCAILNKSQIGDREVNLYVCGASLIAPGIVLTGAHCVNDIKDTSKVVVRCGEWDTQQQIEPEKHVDKRAKHISIHPTFDNKTLNNDFALIHLQEKFQLTDHINTICLPDPHFGAESHGNNDCFATGWGKDKFGSEGEYQVILKQVQMDTVPHGICENQLRKTRLGKNFDLHDSFLCAGGRAGIDTCKGDGGGPLVCPENPSSGQFTRYMQAGIVAWGVGCGSETPGVYANVSQSLRFIDWATKCVEGPDADYYEFGWDSSRWAKREYCVSKNRISELELDVIETKQTLRSIRNRAAKKAVRKTLRSFSKELRTLKKELPGYETAIFTCATGLKDYDCNVRDYDEYDYDYDDRDADLSGLARANRTETATNGLKPPVPRLGGIDG